MHPPNGSIRVHVGGQQTQQQMCLPSAINTFLTHVKRKLVIHIIMCTLLYLYNYVLHILEVPKSCTSICVYNLNVFTVCVGKMLEQRRCS